MPKKCLFPIILVGVVLFSAFCAHAEKVYTLTYQSVYPKGHPNNIICENYTNAVVKASNGKLKFEYHYQEPIPAREALDAAGIGTIDVLNSAPLYYSGKVGIGDYCVMPNNFASYEDAYEIYMQTDLWKIIDRVYRKKANLAVIYPLVLSSPQRFMVSKKTPKVKRLADLKGMKVRGTGGSVLVALKQLGVTPVQTIAGEIYTSLQRGTIDVALFPDYGLNQYKLQEVVDQVVGPYLLPAIVLPLWMNLDVWNSLPKELQDTFHRIAQSREIFMNNLNYMREKDNKIVKASAEQHGVKFYTFPKEDINKMHELVDDPVWNFYVENNEKGGSGEEARHIRSILSKRFKEKTK